MPRVRKKYSSLFKKFPELTRLEGANQYTGGQQDLLASADASISEIRIRNARWRQALQEDWNYSFKKQLEEFIWKDVILREWEGTKLVPSLADIDNIMRSANCPSLRTLIYGEGYYLFKQSYETIHQKLWRTISHKKRSRA